MGPTMTSSRKIPELMSSADDAFARADHLLQGDAHQVSDVTRLHFRKIYAAWRRWEMLTQSRIKKALEPLVLRHVQGLVQAVTGFVSVSARKNPKIAVRPNNRSPVRLTPDDSSSMASTNPDNAVTDRMAIIQRDMCKHIDALPSLYSRAAEDDAGDSPLELLPLDERMYKDVSQYLADSFTTLNEDSELREHLVYTILSRRHEIFARLEKVDYKGVLDINEDFSTSLSCFLPDNSGPLLLENELENGLRRLCPYCTESPSGSGDVGKWLKHICRHAEAYVCTLQPCDHWDHSTLFGLISHEEIYHQSRLVSKSDLVKDPSLDDARTSVKFLKCPFCNECDFPEPKRDRDYTERVEKFYAHLCGHLETITLTTLPKLLIREADYFKWIRPRTNDAVMRDSEGVRTPARSIQHRSVDSGYQSKVRSAAPWSARSAVPSLISDHGTMSPFSPLGAFSTPQTKMSSRPTSHQAPLNPIRLLRTSSTADVGSPEVDMPFPEPEESSPTGNRNSGSSEIPKKHVKVRGREKGHKR